MATTPDATMATTPDAAPATTSHPWQATIQARLIRGVGVDQVEEIDYENDGRFNQRLRVVGGGIAPGQIVALDQPQLAALRAELQAERRAAPVGVDAVGLAVFVDLITEALRGEQLSHRFDTARFGAVSHDESRGVLYGHVGLGGDVAGTVRAVAHALSFEQHVVVMPPGAYRPLSRSDQASLARALAANPPADAGWRAILADAQAGAKP